MSGGPDDLLRAARADLGMSGRPNAVTREYASRHGDAFLRAPWCDMAVTRWARKSGTAEAVLPAGDRAFTPWHADDFRKIGRWYPGTTTNVNRAKPGDIVFFDWGGSNTIGAIDHVGVIERVLGGGRVQTIEANTGDQCLRRIRGAGVIAGYGRPAWGAAGEEDPVIGLKKGDSGEAVEGLQELIVRAGFGEHLGPSGADGDYGPATAEALRLVRKAMGSAAKPGYGDQVTGFAYGQLHAAVARHQAREAGAGGGGQAVDVEAEVRRYLESLDVRLDVSEPNAG